MEAHKNRKRELIDDVYGRMAFLYIGHYQANTANLLPAHEWCRLTDAGVEKSLSQREGRRQDNKEKWMGMDGLELEKKLLRRRRGGFIKVPRMGYGRSTLLLTNPISHNKRSMNHIKFNVVPIRGNENNYRVQA